MSRLREWRDAESLFEDPQDALDLYVKQCSVLVDCRDLALLAATLAMAHPRRPAGQERGGRRHRGRAPWAAGHWRVLARTVVDEARPLKFAVLDFKRVTHVDRAALEALRGLRVLCCI